MQIHDINTGYKPVCGFSIKSELGNSPTLLNPGKTTNFIYEVHELTDEDILYINLINTKIKIIDRMRVINSRRAILEFSDIANYTFASNMEIVDSRLPKLLSNIILYHYFEGISDCEELVRKLIIMNPLKVKTPNNYYPAKLKKFLTAIALGMTPAKEWEGTDEANGGYIIVTKKGEVLAYYIYNRDYFESYLLKNTKLERASTSRYDFATLYKKDGKVFINLNLQIRFK